MESNEGSHTHLRWIVPHAITILIGFGVILYGFSVYVTDKAAGGEFSKSVLSVAFAGSVFTGGLLALPVGRYADKHGVRTMVGAGSTVAALGLAAFSVSQEPWQVIAAWWLIIGPASAAIYYEPAYIAIDQWLLPDRRARAIAILTVIGGLSGIIFIPLAGWLVSLMEWRAAVLVLAALLFVAGGSTALFALPGAPDRTDHVNAQTVRDFALKSLLKDRRFLLYTLAMTIVFLATQGVIIHRVALFSEAGFSLQQVTTWAALASAISLPGRWIGPMLAARFGPIRVQTTIVLIVTTGVLFMLDGTSQWQMIAHFALFGLAFGGIFPLRAMVMSDWFSGPNYGRIMGAQWGITVLIGASGSAIVGISRDISGGYQASIILIIAMLAVAIVAMGASPRFAPAEQDAKPGAKRTGA
ncbi:MAG: MFS transporter [Acidimicrobiales bacterium]